MQGDVVFGAARVYNCRRVRDKMEILDKYDKVSCRAFWDTTDAMQLVPDLDSNYRQFNATVFDQIHPVVTYLPAFSL